MNECKPKTITRMYSRAVVSAFFASLLLASSIARADEQGATLFFYAYDNPNFQTVASDIDASGRVVGYYVDDGGVAKGFVRDRRGKYTDLVSTLPGTETTVPVAMNDRGTIVGNYRAQIDSKYYNGAWAYERATAVFSPIAVPGALTTTVQDISADGTIVGYANFTSSSQNGLDDVGFILRAGQYTIITTPGARTTVLLSVNDNGVIGGSYGDNRYSSYRTGFLMDLVGTRTVLDAHLYGYPIQPDVLANNGDVLSACNLGEDVYSLCVYPAATQVPFVSQAPRRCPYYNTFVQSMKRGAAVGYCQGGGLIGWVTRKSQVYSPAP